jgi:1,4-alpha-glucan branching enzyme
MTPRQHRPVLPVTLPRLPVPAGRRPRGRAATAALRLFAPTVDAVAVVGSWAPGVETPLARDASGEWRVALPLADGSYTYRFRTRSRSWFQEGQWVEFVDPRARQVVMRDDGEWGVLIMRQRTRVVDAYRWRHERAHLPRDRELVIYELHVGDFSGGPGDTPRTGRKGRFTDVVARLPYLKELGVNALELMPVQAVPGDTGWGYTPRHFFAPRPGYGTPSELKQLIDACHGQGMRVIADMVCNHADVETPLAQIDHDYWFHHRPPAGQPSYGPKFNVELVDPGTGVMPARKFLNEMLLFWVSEYHLDGIRFDATALIDNFDFLGWIGERLKEETDSKPFLLIGEHIPHDPAVVGHRGPMDSAWHDTFYFAVTATLCGRELEGRRPFDPDALLAALDPQREGFWGPRATVQYLENHDHERLARELASAGTEGGEALRRAALGATLLLTAVGIPMLYHGQELAMSTPKTLGASKLDWTLFARPAHRALRERYRALIALRTSTPALQSAFFECLAVDPERRLLAYRRWASQYHGGGEVIVVANCGDADVPNWDVPGWPRRDTWREVFGAGAIRAGSSETAVRVNVPRWSARIFTRAGPALDG